jgi:hypothetical protein
MLRADHTRGNACLELPDEEALLLDRGEEDCHKGQFNLTD